MSANKKLIEAALFMSPGALSPMEVAALAGCSEEEAAAVLEELLAEYGTRETAVQIIRTSDSRFKMSLKDDYQKPVSHLAVGTDFTKAQLRTLGLVLAKQPVRQSFVVRVIGNKAYEYVKGLEEDGFLRSEKWRNTKLLSTTPKFEEYFGVNKLPEAPAKKA